jgi:hypothetical protein
MVHNSLKFTPLFFNPYLNQQHCELNGPNVMLERSTGLKKSFFGRRCGMSLCSVSLMPHGGKSV